MDAAGKGNYKRQTRFCREIQRKTRARCPRPLKWAKICYRFRTAIDKRLSLPRYIPIRERRRIGRQLTLPIPQRNPIASNVHGIIYTVKRKKISDCLDDRKKTQSSGKRQESTDNRLTRLVMIARPGGCYTYVRDERIYIERDLGKRFLPIWGEPGTRKKSRRYTHALWLNETDRPNE